MRDETRFFPPSASQRPLTTHRSPSTGLILPDMPNVGPQIAVHCSPLQVFRIVAASVHHSRLTEQPMVRPSGCSGHVGCRPSNGRRWQSLAVFWGASPLGLSRTLPLASFRGRTCGGSTVACARSDRNAPNMPNTTNARDHSSAGDDVPGFSASRSAYMEFSRFMDVCSSWCDTLRFSLRDSMASIAIPSAAHFTCHLYDRQTTRKSCIKVRGFLGVALVMGREAPSPSSSHLGMEIESPSLPLVTALFRATAHRPTAMDP
jgi:hypothetical protein